MNECFHAKCGERERERHPCVPRVNTIIPTFPFIRSTPAKHAATSRKCLSRRHVDHTPPPPSPLPLPPPAPLPFQPSPPPDAPRPFFMPDPPRHCLKSDFSLSFSARQATQPPLDPIELLKRAPPDHRSLGATLFAATLFPRGAARPVSGRIDELRLINDVPSDGTRLATCMAGKVCWGMVEGNGSESIAIKTHR